MAIDYVSFPQLTCYPGPNENEWSIDNIWRVTVYVPGEWNGTAGNLVKFYSDTPGSQAIIDLSAIGDISVSYMDFKDIAFIGGTVTADATCVNGGNNSGINWGAVGGAGGSWIIGSAIIKGVNR